MIGRVQKPQNSVVWVGPGGSILFLAGRYSTRLNGTLGLERKVENLGNQSLTLLKFSPIAFNTHETFVPLFPTLQTLQERKQVTSVTSTSYPSP